MKASLLGGLLLLSLPSFAQEVRWIEDVMKSLATVTKTELMCETQPPFSRPGIDEESKLIADKKWKSGASDCSLAESKLPPYEVLKVNDGYFILRQNKCVNFEAPFLYLIIGTKGAVLIDTGASSESSDLPLREWVDSVLPKDITLVVAHSHSHGDHIAGDGQFRDGIHV